MSQCSVCGELLSHKNPDKQEDGGQIDALLPEDDEWWNGPWFIYWFDRKRSFPYGHKKTTRRTFKSSLRGIWA